MAQHTIEGTGEGLMQILCQQPKDRFRLTSISTEQKFLSFEEALAQTPNRTADEVAAACTRLIQASPPPRPLPPDQTLEDVLQGKWPGNETDEQIAEALGRLS